MHSGTQSMADFICSMTQGKSLDLPKPHIPVHAELTPALSSQNCCTVTEALNSMKGLYRVSATEGQQYSPSECGPHPLKSPGALRYRLLGWGIAQE